VPAAIAVLGYRPGRDAVTRCTRDAGIRHVTDRRRRATLGRPRPRRHPADQVAEQPDHWL